MIPRAAGAVNDFPRGPFVLKVSESVRRCPGRGLTGAPGPFIAKGDITRQVLTAAHWAFAAGGSSLLRLFLLFALESLRHKPYAYEQESGRL